MKFVLLLILASVITCCESVAAAAEDACNDVSADVAFIVDASGSVGEDEWKQSLDFAVNVVKGFDIGKDQVRVGMISFSTSTKLVFDFNRYNTKDAVMNAISKAPKVGGSTYTYRALDQARTELFQARSGLRVVTPNITIVITDGASHSRQDTISAAKALQKHSVIIFAVGVKGAVEKELNGIASKLEYVFSFSGYDDLKNAQQKIRNAACKVVKKFQPTTSTTPRTTVTTTSTTATTTPTTVTTTPTTDKITPTTEKTTSTTVTTTPTTSTQANSTSPQYYCDPDCHDKAMSCASYNTEYCSSKQFESFLRLSCAKTCGFCTPIDKCQPLTPQYCVDKEDCSVYFHSACVQFKDWALETCPRRCGLCDHLTSEANICKDSLADCPLFGTAVCTYDVDWAKQNCAQYCGHCTVAGDVVG